MIITVAPCISLPQSQPRAIGNVRVDAHARDGRSHIAQLMQRGSLKLLFPNRAEKALTAVLLNTAGGVTGGDRFHTTATALAQSELTLTTQAAERGYRAQPDETGKIMTELAAHSGARIEWLPQETILYDGASIDRRLRLRLPGNARGLIVEPVIFGRTAMGETVNHLHFRDRIDIERDGKLILSDRTRITGDAARTLSRRATGAGSAAMATLIYVGDDADLRLERARKDMPPNIGASQPHPGVVCARVLAQDGFALRKSLIPLISSFRDTPDLPRTWMI